MRCHLHFFQNLVSHPLDTGAPYHPPELQRIKSFPQGYLPILIVPNVVILCKLVLVNFKVNLVAHRFSQLLLFTHVKQAAMQPTHHKLGEVYLDRVCQLQPFHLIPVLRDHPTWARVGSIDIEPELVFLAELSDWFNWVVCASGCRSKRRPEPKGNQPIFDIVLNHLFCFSCIDYVVLRFVIESHRHCSFIVDVLQK